MPFKSLALSLLDPRGRCNRKGLIIAAAILLALEFAVAFILWQSGAPLDSPLAIALKMVMLYMAVVAAVLRLHDTGRSAWWMLWSFAGLLVWAIVLAIAAASFFTIDQMQLGGPGFGVVFTGLVIPMFAALMWLHCAPGQGSANRFGPSPTGWGFSRREAHVDRAVYVGDLRTA